MEKPEPVNRTPGQSIRRALRTPEPRPGRAPLRGDGINRLRRRLEMLSDQALALLRHKLLPPPVVEPFDGDPRLALITVNCSTTRVLKLMLLTLGEQRALSLVRRLIIIDNDSRDGGRSFIRALAARIPRIHLLENRFFPTHARGMRSGVALLDALETDTPARRRANLLLFCDPDIIFRNRDALSDLAQAIIGTDAAFAGELRRGSYPYPEAQASFFAVRRDCYARPDVMPLVHHGAPAYFMQRSLWRAGLHLEHFPSNSGGHILHRGRSAVAATRRYRPDHAHATAARHAPHYMGVPGGERIWRRTEARYAELLQSANEQRLLEFLSSRLSEPVP